MNDTNKISFILGKESSNFLKIMVANYAYPQATDFWDGNWLTVRITIKTGGFTADYVGQLRNSDFMDFNRELKSIYNNLEGQAQFHSMEDYIQITIFGDGLGHFTADCIAKDELSINGNILKFTIDFDQTEIHELNIMIEKIIEQFPLKGNDRST